MSRPTRMASPREWPSPPVSGSLSRSATPPPSGGYAQEQRPRSVADALLSDDDAAVRSWAAGALAAGARTPPPRGATPPAGGSQRGERSASPSPIGSGASCPQSVVYASFTPPPPPSSERAPSRAPSRATPPTAEGSADGGASESAPSSSAAAAAPGADGEVISVCIRMRGLNEREAAEGLAWKVDGKYVWEAEAEAKAEARGGDVTAYEFPAVFGAAATQQEVYAFVRPVVLGFLSGYNGTIFAYGQTSAGKTYTMQGPRDAPGIIPRALADLFAHLNAARQRAAVADAAANAAAAAAGLPAPGASFRCRVSLSYCELYNEELIDLLAAEQPPGGLIVRDGAQERGAGFVAVEGLREVVVADVAAAAACLAEGEARRHVAATAMNRASSRSHAILRVVLDAAAADPSAPLGAPDAERFARRRSALSLVDLAGSERASTRGGANGSLWAEGCAINMGLLSLGRVVRALAAAGGGEAGVHHVPYRDSKLTRLLAGALGGNARAAAVCCATPSAAYAADTRGTLRFAERCMLVAQRAVLNESLGARAQLAQAQKEVAKLRALVSQLQAQLQAERRRTATGGGAGPAEEGLLAALEEEVERLRAAAAAAEDTAAAERAMRADAQRRLAQLQASLGLNVGSGSSGGGAAATPPGAYSTPLTGGSGSGSGSGWVTPPAVTPPASPHRAASYPSGGSASASASAAAAAAAAAAATELDLARVSSAERSALARQLVAAAAAAEAQRASNAAAGGAVNELYRTLAAQGAELRAVRADLARAASPRPGPSPLPPPVYAQQPAVGGTREFWAAALGDSWEIAQGGAHGDGVDQSVTDSLASPRSLATWRAAVADAGAEDAGAPRVSGGYGSGPSYY